MIRLQKIDSTCFDWILWRNGTLKDLGLPATRKVLMIENSHTLNRHALGYCDGEDLMCRPKLDHKAIMFQKDDNLFWTHIRNEEFELVFNL